MRSDTPEKKNELGTEPEPASLGLSYEGVALVDGADYTVEYGEIEIAGKWATVTDAARALRKLDVPGWSYPVDAERVIEDFESNVEDAFNDADIPYDAPIFEW